MITWLSIFQRDIKIILKIGQYLMKVWKPLRIWCTRSVARLRRITFTIEGSNLHCWVTERACGRSLRSTAIPLLAEPFTRTYFCRRAFRFLAPSVWSSLPRTVLMSDSLSIFKSRLIFARDSIYAKRAYAIAIPSVCLSVRLSHGWFMQKRL